MTMPDTKNKIGSTSKPIQIMGENMNESIVLEAAERLKIGLLAKATDGYYLDKDFKEDMRVVSSDNRVSMMLPKYASHSREIGIFILESFGREGLVLIFTNAQYNDIL